MGSGLFGWHDAAEHKVVINTYFSEDCACILVNRAGLSAEANLKRSVVSETMASGVNVTSGSESNSSRRDAYGKP